MNGLKWIGKSTVCSLGALALMAGVLVGASGAASGAGLTPAATKYMKAQLAAYKKVPTFKAPGPAFNASTAKGKSVIEIPTSTAIPFVAGVATETGTIASQLGITYTNFENQGTLTSWVSGINEAITQKANLILFQGAPNPASLQPQLTQAQAAGIKIENAHFYNTGAAVPKHVDALVPVNFTEAATLDAYGAALASGGHAQVLVIETQDIPVSELMVNAVKKALSTYCPGCSVKVVNVDVAGWATQIEPTVEAQLRSNPGMHYIIPCFDSESEFVAPAIQAVGETGKTFIYTYNGTPAILKMMETGNVVKMDVGEDLTWLAWADMDQALRLLTGNAPVASENTALRVFTPANVAQTGTPPAFDAGFGSAFVAGYEQLWGISGLKP